MNAIRVTRAPRIRRTARIHFLARRSLPRFQLQLSALPASNWPQHLSAAWTILNKELALPDPKARSIVLQSISAAHNCVRAQNQRLHDIVVARARATIHDACRRIAKCIKRAPAWLRRHLDQAMLSPIRESMIDLEVIESIFALTTMIFEESPTAEPSRAALKALYKIDEAHFDALGIELRGKVEGSITDLVANSTIEHPVRAASVFDTIATALDGEKMPKMSSQSRKLITTYVAELAEIWQQAGLKPSRAIAYLDDAYRSKFHRFAELILIAMAAPRALQYDLRKLPDEHEPWKAMQRVDYHWLVSDDHVREALQQIQILSPKTP